MAVSPAANQGAAAPAGAPRSSTLASHGAKATVVGMLTTVFNVLALNLALLLASLPILTAPAALQAATVALERWRLDREDRVVREFLAALRSQLWLRTTVSVGAPVIAAALALEEVHYFSRGGTVVDWLCLGLGVDGLVLSLASLGFVLVLGARRPGLPATDVWHIAASLAIRNVLRSSPVLVGELIAGALLLALDPALAVLGLPVAVLGLVRCTADRGIRRTDRDHGHATAER